MIAALAFIALVQAPPLPVQASPGQVPPAAASAPPSPAPSPPPAEDCRCGVPDSPRGPR